MQGGGIFAVGDVTLDASTVNSNTVNGYGGGIFGSYNVAFDQQHCCAGNSASGVGIGGGIFAGGVASLTDATTDNDASSAGGAVAAHDVTTNNTIVLGNYARDFAPDVSGVLSSNGHNLFGSLVDGAVAGDFQGFGAESVRATQMEIGVFGGLLEINGGPTLTAALLDKAYNSALSRAEPDDILVDQRGEPHPGPGRNQSRHRRVRAAAVAWHGGRHRARRAP